jgi:hypothetical protein
LHVATSDYETRPHRLSMDNLTMRFSMSTATNAAAWAVLFGLIGVAIAMVAVLGPFGLILLGVLTLFVCTSIDLREDAPTWGIEVFKARLARHGLPEQRFAMLEERGRTVAPLRFYRWCGVALVAAGIAGFVWLQLR